MGIDRSETVIVKLDEGARGAAEGGGFWRSSIGLGKGSVSSDFPYARGDPSTHRAQQILISKRKKRPT